MRKGIVENRMFQTKEHRIIWEEGEFENLRKDVLIDGSGVTRLKPKNALNLLKLATAKMMQKGNMNDEDIEFREEEELLYTLIFGGTFLNERGQILWNLLGIISPIILRKTES